MLLSTTWGEEEEGRRTDFVRGWIYRGSLEANRNQSVVELLKTQSNTKAYPIIRESSHVLINKKKDAK
jgi:hypothetical protein